SGPLPLIQQRLPAPQARRAPHVATLVVLLERTGSGRQHDPWLPGLRIDVNVGPEAVWLIERPDAYKAHEVPQSAVVTPDRHATHRTAGDDLALAARAGGRHQLRPRRKQHHFVRFEQCIERKRTAGLTLTPAAVAAVHDQGRTRHTIAHHAA